MIRVYEFTITLIIYLVFKIKKNIDCTMMSPSPTIVLGHNSPNPSKSKERMS